MKSTIEVFILTQNRIDLLKASINSILNQTIIPKLTVIDNNSSDGTEEYLKRLGINYYKQPHFVSFYKNLKTAQNMAEADYVMFFHDDDILHPQYIEVALKLIDMYKNVDLICSMLSVFKTGELLKQKIYKEIKYIKFNKKIDFVDFVYTSFFTEKYSSICFPNVIYKTNNIKNIFFDQKKYGKIGDKPFVVNSIKNGICIQIREPMLNYRIHSQQMSVSTSDNPLEYEIINHNKFFKKIMSKKIKSYYHFNVFSMNWLIALFYWAKLPSREAFIKKAYKSNAIGLYGYWLENGILKKHLNNINNYFKQKIAKTKIATEILNLRN